MRWFERMPWWAWFGANTTLLYLIYNPFGFSLVDMWAEGWEGMVALKMLVTAVCITILGIVLRATMKSIGILGSGVVIGLLMLMLWAMVEVGMGGILLDSSAWLVQPLMAVVMTVGLRWSRIYRTITGQVTVDPIHSGHVTHADD